MPHAIGPSDSQSRDTFSVKPQSPLVSEQTFFEFAATTLYGFCHAAGFDDRECTDAIGCLGECLVPWGSNIIGTKPSASSDIGDDHFPIEFSLALSGADPEVRVLFEAQAPDGLVASRWKVARILSEKLATVHSVPFERFQVIEDLFAPRDPHARYALWHSICWRRGTAPKFKIYLNPQAQGKARAPAIVMEAVRRLGFQRAGDAVTGSIREQDELKFFSLDLDSSPDARVKIYRAHHRSTRNDIDAELARMRPNRQGILDDFWEKVVGFEGPFNALPPTTYLALTSGHEEPTSATVHFPVRAYSENDQIIRQRLQSFLQPPDRDVYERVIGAFARRPLNAGVGMHSYVAVTLGNVPRATIYLAPEPYNRVTFASPVRKPRCQEKESRIMRQILAVVAERANEFDRSPLFRFVDDLDIAAVERLGYAPYLAHFVMTFADLYRFVFREEPAVDELQEVVNAHAGEDAGHWKWFLADLAKLGYDRALPFSDALRLVWSDRCIRTRMLSYEMCRLGLKATPLEKLVLVQCIEAAGAISLRHVANAAVDFTSQTGIELLYMGHHHVRTENQHTLERPEVRAMVEMITLSAEQFSKLSSLVEQAFMLFRGFTDDLLAIAETARHSDQQAFAGRPIHFQASPGGTIE